MHTLLPTVHSLLNCQHPVFVIYTARNRYGIVIWGPDENVVGATYQTCCVGITTLLSEIIYKTFN